MGGNKTIAASIHGERRQVACRLSVLLIGCSLSGFIWVR